MELASFERRSPIDATPAELYAWHAAPQAFVRLSPPWEPAEIESEEGPFETRRVVLRLAMGPLHLRWIAQHGDAIPGRQFRDTQLQGPFAHWEHLHRFEDAGPGSCTLHDQIRYALPLGALGRLGGGAFVRKKLERMFDYRHAVTQGDLARHRALGLRRFRVALESRGSPVLTRALGAFLATGGHVLTRENPEVRIALSGERQAELEGPAGTTQLHFAPLLAHALRPRPKASGPWLALDDAVGAIHFVLMRGIAGGHTVEAADPGGLGVAGFTPRHPTYQQASAFELGRPR